MLLEATNSQGDSLQLHDPANNILVDATGLRGFDYPNVRFYQEQFPYSDGAYHLGQVIEPRDLEIPLIVSKATTRALENYFKSLHDLFTPEDIVTLRCTMLSSSIYEIDVRGFRIRAAQAGTHSGDVALVLNAADPFFYQINASDDTRNFSEDSGAVAASPVNAVVDYDGQWITPPTLVITTALKPPWFLRRVVDGSVVDEIKFSTGIASGKEGVVDVRYGTVYETTSYNYVTNGYAGGRNSLLNSKTGQFFSIEKGTQTFRLAGNPRGAGLRLFVYYKKRFLGIR